MHYIIAGTMVQANHFAAALKLREHDWTFCSDPAQFRSAPPTAFHLLPGASPAVAGAAIGWAKMQNVPLHHLG